MEMEERQKNREFEERQKDKELELRNKELEHNVSLAASQSTIPPFQEKEVDIYFLHFKIIAKNLKWSKENWTLLLQNVLIGEARDVYTQLSVGQSSFYETVKEMILKSYELCLRHTCNNLEIVGKTLIKLTLNLQGLKRSFLINGVL